MLLSIKYLSGRRLVCLDSVRDSLTRMRRLLSLTQSLWVLWECVFDSVYMFVVSLRLFIYTQRTVQVRPTAYL